VSWQGNAQVVAGNLVPRSQVWATYIDVLPADRVVLRRDGYWVVASPSNPGHYWGNFLIFDSPPAVGDGARWPACFAAELPGLEHCTLAWDVTDGGLGEARSEFPGFALEQTVGLVAVPGALIAHPRASDAVTVRLLGTVDPAWDEVLALWLAHNAADGDRFPVAAYELYARTRLGELRVLFSAGRGGWYVAECDGRVVGSLGIVITDGRARYQSVDTRAADRSRGIASALVVEAARQAADTWPISSFVIAADAGYHALGIYESLGFSRVEQVSGLCRWAPEEK
jgi:ribosomal protein S18 acetylase RimI-like enzyme